MADSGISLLLGLLSIVTAISLFAASGFIHFIKGLIPEGKFATIFPYLSTGGVLLGMMMLVYSLVFFSDRPIIAPLTSVLFFLGALSMMLGAYKITKEIQSGDEAQAGTKK